MRRRKRGPQSTARQRHEPGLIDRMRPGHWVALVLVIGGLLALFAMESGRRQRAWMERQEAHAEARSLRARRLYGDPVDVR